MTAAISRMSRSTAGMMRTRSATSRSCVAGSAAEARARSSSAPAALAAGHDKVALEQVADQLVERARRAAQRGAVLEEAGRDGVERAAKLAQQALRLGRVERAELDALGRRVQVAEARMALVERRRRGADDGDRRPLQAGHQVVQEVDAVRLEGVEVLEAQDQRRDGGVGGQEAAQGQEGARLELLRRVGQRGQHLAVGERHAHHVGEQVRGLGDARRRHDPRHRGQDAGAALVEPVAGRQPEASRQQAGERGEQDAGSVGGADQEADVGPRGRRGAGQLLDGAALAHARLAVEQRERQRTRLAGAPDRGGQLGQRRRPPGVSRRQLERRLARHSVERAVRDRVDQRGRIDALDPVGAAQRTEPPRAGHGPTATGASRASSARASSSGRHVQPRATLRGPGVCCQLPPVRPRDPAGFDGLSTAAGSTRGRKGTRKNR